MKAGRISATPTKVSPSTLAVLEPAAAHRTGVAAARTRQRRPYAFVLKWRRWEKSGRCSPAASVDPCPFRRPTTPGWNGRPDGGPCPEMAHRESNPSVPEHGLPLPCRGPCDLGGSVARAREAERRSVLCEGAKSARENVRNHWASTNVDEKKQLSKNLEKMLMSHGVKPLKIKLLKRSIVGYRKCKEKGENEGMSLNVIENTGGVFHRSGISLNVLEN